MDVEEVHYDYEYLESLRYFARILLQNGLPYAYQ